MLCIGNAGCYFPRSCSVIATNQIHASYDQPQTQSILWECKGRTGKERKNIYRVYERNNTLSGYCRIF